MSNITDIKDGEKKDTEDQLDLEQLSQSLEGLYHRCSFLFVGLENIAFRATSVHHKKAAHGVCYYTTDLLDELLQIREMVKKGLKSGVQQ